MLCSERNKLKAVFLNNLHQFFNNVQTVLYSTLPFVHAIIIHAHLHICCHVKQVSLYIIHDFIIIIISSILLSMCEAMRGYGWPM